MIKLTKLGQLQEKVVDTEADYRRYKAAWGAAWGAYDAWVKAKRDLSNYLEEQQDNA